MRVRRWIPGLLPVVVSASLSGCSDLTVPDLNNPSVESLRDNPTPQVLAAAVQGLMRGARDNVADMVVFLGAFGREGYAMSQDGAELLGTVRNPLNGASFPGNTLWEAPYRNIRLANLVLDAVNDVDELTAGEKEGVRGFTKTIQAYDFLNVSLTRDRFGAPIEVGTDPNADLAPFRTRDEVRAHVAQLLDEARGHLEAASSFPFGVTSGLAAFSTPAEFVRLNRALRARLAVYMDDWNAALTALSESFLDPAAPLDFGASHVFSTVSGDEVNPLNAPGFLFAHTRIREEAQLRADGGLDLRAVQKTVERPPFTVSGVTSNLNFTMYNRADAPIPWVKNEELILLRAEANIGLGRTAEAAADINLIRERSGGLEPIAITATNALDELLYNKRYSLLYEYGHVWIDLRHYDRLLTDIPTTPADPLIVDVMPIPESECAARSPRPDGCGAVAPLAP